jgi:hypothetical protein
MKDWIFDRLPAILVVTIILILILISLVPALHVSSYTVEVIKTEITGDNNYMVFCKDTATGKSHTFTLNDSLWHGVWNTADMYAQLIVGNTYTFRASGWRIPLLSKFPNIIEIKEV